jgi:hypothetical protein
MKQHKGAVIVTSDYEVDVRKHIFGLQQLSGVSLMEEVVNSIGIDSDRTWCFAAVGHFVGYLLGVVAQLSYPNCFRLIAERRRSTNRLQRDKNQKLVKSSRHFGLSCVAPVIVLNTI